MGKALIFLVAAGVLVFAQFASGESNQAATWDVAVGEQGKPPAGTPKGTTLNQFFPAKLQINAGDKVTFTSFAFHTVSYLAGKSPPPLVAPAKGVVYEGITDSAGQPFYFDGQQAFSYNVSVFGPFGPKSISGRTQASTGAIFATTPKKPAKATYAFPKVGVQASLPGSPGHGDEHRGQAEGCRGAVGGGRGRDDQGRDRCRVGKGEAACGDEAACPDRHRGNRRSEGKWR
jgi:plastocyanin